MVYRQLDEVQGELIPVFFGNISLVRPFFLDTGVRIVHMLLLSWAGEQAHKDLMLAIGRDLAAETSGVVAVVIRLPNVLLESRDQKCSTGGF